jgi:hypothetical protein
MPERIDSYVLDKDTFKDFYDTLDTMIKVNNQIVDRINRLEEVVQKICVYITGSEVDNKPSLEMKIGSLSNRLCDFEWK